MKLGQPPFSTPKNPALASLFTAHRLQWCDKGKCKNMTKDKHKSGHKAITRKRRNSRGDG